MKKILMFIPIALIALSVSAQQSITSDNVNDFSVITLQGNLSVEIIPSTMNAIDITLIDADITKLKWTSNDGVLNVSLKPGQKGRGSADVKIHYADTVNVINISGAEVINHSPITAKMLKLNISSGARATMNVNATDVEIDVTGNSAAQISGFGKYLSLRATEKSKVDTRAMETISADVETTTQAEVYVAAEERLVAAAKTSSSIFYKGKPMIIKDNSPKINLSSSVLNIGE